MAADTIGFLSVALRGEGSLFREARIAGGTAVRASGSLQPRCHGGEGGSSGLGHTIMMHG